MVVYKYLKKEHLLEFKDKGTILINTLYNLRTVDEALRDEFEGRRQLLAGSKQKLTTFSANDLPNISPAFKVPEQSKEIKIVLEAGAIIDSNIQVSNAFVFCLSLKCDEKLASKFGYDAYYKITDPFSFAKVIFDKLNESVTIKCYKVDKVKYTDKSIQITEKNVSKIVNDFWDICFTKPKKFREEQEFRMIFVPLFKREIKPTILSCPEIWKYCKF